MNEGSQFRSEVQKGLENSHLRFQKLLSSFLHPQSVSFLRQPQRWYQKYLEKLTIINDVGNFKEVQILDFCVYVSF